MSEVVTNYAVEDIETPATVYVNCPLHGDRYPLVSVNNYCAKCEYFQGFFKQDYKGQEVPFSKEYSVRCGLPVSRPITEVVN